MLAIIVTMFVAIEHLGIMALEIFGNPAQQAKAFDLPLKFTQQHEARVSFANQGIYNGALGAAIIASYWLFSGATLVLVWRMLLVFVMVVALFGALTATKKIILIQFFSLMIEYKPIHQLRSVRLMRLLILVKIGHRQVAFEHNYVQAEMPQ